MKQRHHLLALSLALAWCAATPAQAGVIPGTGAVPSATQLGATSAVAFKVAESGPGHLLLVPYFTAQNGQMSVLHLVNTDLDNGKAVKLRYRSAGNGDYLLSLQVLLAPGDVWTGVVSQGADGLAQIATADQSCTYPRLAPGGAPQSFSTHRLNPKDAPETQRRHTREGTIEAIVMADIPQAAVYGPGANSVSALATSLQEVFTPAVVGVEAPKLCDPQVLDDALLNNTNSEPVAAARGLAAPTGGVLGTWYIIDVPGSTAFSGAATAIQAVNAAGQPARGNYVLFPQSGDDVTAPEFYTADPALASGGFAYRVKQANGQASSPIPAPVVRAKYYDLPDLSTPYYLPTNVQNARATAADLTRALTVKSVSNQYATDVPISAKTDWVLSMPTRRYSVGLDYNQPAADARVFSVVPPADGSGNQYFHSGNTSVESTPAYTTIEGAPVLHYMRPTRVCSAEAVGPQLFADRNAVVQGAAMTLFKPVLCGAANVLAFGDAGASALGASVARETIASGLSVNGWSTLRATSAANPLGLPLLGAAFTKLTNPSVQAGVAGNYGITWPHSFTR